MNAGFLKQEDQIRALNDMGFQGFSSVLAGIYENPQQYDSLDFSDRLALCIQAQSDYERQKKVARLLKNAGLKDGIQMHDLEISAARGLSKETVTLLMSGKWIARKANIVIDGPCGSGKTGLVSALASYLCSKCISVRYFSTARVIAEFLSKDTKGQSRMLKTLDRTQVLILDDFLSCSVNIESREALFHIVEGRFGNVSTIISSQIRCEGWRKMLGGEQLSESIVDRLHGHAIDIHLTGESYRARKDDLLIPASQPEEAETNAG